MRKFAWLTFITGLLLSTIAGFYSIIGLAMIFSGAYWPVIALTGTLEVAKLIAVSWMYRYRQFAGRLFRLYFYSAILVLMVITSMGIFGYLTRAHVESESTYVAAQLTLQEIQQREGQLTDERTQLNTELKTLNEQSTQLVKQLGDAQRLRGTQGAVAVQRDMATRRNTLLTDLKRINTDLAAVQKERVATETETNAATADIGPLRYVAQALYGTDDVTTVRKSVVILTGILMIVFDPMAIMLLIAANILFLRLSPSASPSASLTTSAPMPVVDSVIPTPATNTTDRNSTDVPPHLIRGIE